MEPKWRSLLKDLRPFHKIFLQSKYDTIMDLKIFYTLNKHHENGLRIYSFIQITSKLKWKCLVIKVCYFWLWLHGLEMSQQNWEDKMKEDSQEYNLICLWSSELGCHSFGSLRWSDLQHYYLMSYPEPALELPLLTRNTNHCLYYVHSNL